EFHFRVHTKWIETEGSDTPAGNARLLETPQAEKLRRLKDRPRKGSACSGKQHLNGTPIKKT
uniref:hypothetical protein n=1 Tax=Peribacillus muralis TaxID=264697 RepID=UPI000708A3EA